MSGCVRTLVRYVVVCQPVEPGQMGYMCDVEEEVEEAEEEELGHTETYANYMPAKCTFPSTHK